MSSTNTVLDNLIYIYYLITKKDIWRRSISFLGVKIWEAIILAKIDLDISQPVFKRNPWRCLLWVIINTIFNKFTSLISAVTIIIIRLCSCCYSYFILVYWIMFTAFRFTFPHIHPLYLFNLQKIQNETDIGTYKPIGFLSPLQYKILHLVLTNQINLFTFTPLLI